MIERAELPAGRVRTIIDYYHASKHIADALRVCKNLSDRDRQTHHRALRRLLLQPGGPQQVIEQLSELARGRRGKKVNREIRYLRKHLDTCATTSGGMPRSRSARASSRARSGGRQRDADPSFPRTRPLPGCQAEEGGDSWQREDESVPEREGSMGVLGELWPRNDD